MNLTILSLTSRSFPSKSIFQSLLKLLLKLHNTFSGGESLISLDSTKIKERKKIQYQFLYNKKKVTKSARNSSVTSLRPDNASLQHLYEIMTSNGPMLIVQWRFVASDNWPGKSSDISSLHPQVRVYFSFSFLFFFSLYRESFERGREEYGIRGPTSNCSCQSWSNTVDSWPRSLAHLLREKNVWLFD